MERGPPNMTLADLGELRLIEEVLLPLARKSDPTTEVGNDCSFLSIDAGILAVTADVGPKPLLRSLGGYENDWLASGWLSVVTTASDIATAGASPVLLTNCVDAPPHFPLAVR
jgi:thiamine-monophosphate kinase